MTDFKNDPIIDKLKELGIGKLDPFMMAIDQFVDSTVDWNKKLADILDSDEPDPMTAKYINDQMIKLDKNFLLSQGIPDQSLYR